MNLLFATSNAGKIIELSAFLTRASIKLLTPGDLDLDLPPPEETGNSFAENAQIKARYYHHKTGMATVADDSGIFVNALRDELGIHTRRWGAGAQATDEEWITYFLRRMKRESHRRAAFICSIAYIAQDGSEHIFEGTCEGVITQAIEAEYLPGLPLSAVFKPDGCDHVFSALDHDTKNRISHRGKAMRKCVDFLNSTMEKSQFLSSN